MITVDKKKGKGKGKRNPYKNGSWHFKDATKESWKWFKIFSDRAAQQRTEREALFQQMKDQGDPDKEDLIKALN